MPTRASRCALILVLCLFCGCHLTGPPWSPPPGHLTLNLWLHRAPGAPFIALPEANQTTSQDELVAGKPVVRLHHVTTPTLTLYMPAANNTGAAIVVMPGGGYQFLVPDLEGTEVCDWLSSVGINCILLKYRVPRSGPYPTYSAALQDAQRTMGIVRSHAVEWHIDPHRVGVLGFSAAANLAAALGSHFDHRLYDPVDAADNLSCRPDFTILMYPGYMTVKDQPALPNPDVLPIAGTPPTLIVQAEDDRIGVENSITAFLALKRAGVPTELHIYAEGGHGYGLRPNGLPVSTWPHMVETWLHTIHILR